ncbi:hypothetical protein Y1Q_0001121 [Alligator mississippiensis]|uniref:Uncharacterized protein n=1 Tax=Alligator mississippiensis TaxID=8496 RepID=A0A151M3X5_ALLMI|nr:hypothetical protein Y1Q_0001121 [Alligator mississippiensis]
MGVASPTPRTCWTISTWPCSRWPSIRPRRRLWPRETRASVRLSFCNSFIHISKLVGVHRLPRLFQGGSGSWPVCSRLA